jgi:hypothetical protein
MFRLTASWPRLAVSSAPATVALTVSPLLAKVKPLADAEQGF